MSDGDMTIVCGDCRDVMASMPERSVECCVTSPPYFGCRTYDGQGEDSIGAEDSPQAYVSRLASCFDGVMRVLKDDGTLWLNVGDCFARRNYGKIRRKEQIGVPAMLALVMRERGWRLRQDVIWSKPNAMPESVRDRFTCCHEHVMLFTKSEDYYFSYEDSLEECVTTSSKFGGNKYAGQDHRYGGVRRKEHVQAVRDIRFGGSKYGDSDDPHHGGKSGKVWHPASKVVDGVEVPVRKMRDVWILSAAQYGGEHFATFPERLVRPCILIGCPPGGTVMDPFSGAGTTGLVALKNGRRYVGIEVSQRYCDMQRERIEAALKEER